MFTPELHPVDLWIVGGYALTMIIIGIVMSGRSHDAEDYFLAGRSMGWLVIGFSLFASNISSTTLVGLAGDAYSTGISVYNYEWMAGIILAFYAIFILPQVLRSQVYTMPEYLEKRFDRRARSIFALLTLFLNIVVDTAASLYAGSLILQMIFPELAVWQIITVLALVAGAYTILGGLSAVMLTDVIQAALLIIGSVVITAFAFAKIGDNWGAVTAAVPPDMLSLVRPLDDPGVPWLGLLTGIPLLGFYFWCTNQFMAQRLLSAKNTANARWGALLAGLLKLPVLFIMVLPGTLAILIYPDLERPDLVFPTLMFDLLPTGMLGLVLAGFMAALMSQIDSTLNSASTLVTMDFIRPRHPELSSGALMNIGRMVTFGFMLLAVLWAPQIANFDSLFKYLQQVLSYTVGPIVALFLFGTFWRRANAVGAFWALIIGFTAGILFFILNVVTHSVDVHFLYVAPILFVVSSFALIVASYLAPAAKDVDAFIWTPALYKLDTAELADQPWYTNYRLQAVILILLTGVILITFW